MNLSFTIGELAKRLNEPEWRVRRIVDALGVHIPRAGLYRLVPAELLPQIEEALRADQAPVPEAAQ